MKSRLHQECYARSCPEIEEMRRRCYQEETTEKQQRPEEFLTQHDQESSTLSLLRDQVRRLQKLLVYIEDSKIFHDPDSPSSYDSTYVLHQALTTSSSRKPSREVGMLRNTLENMCFPGKVFDCQHARRAHDELHSDSRNLATPTGIKRREGIEKSGSEEPLQWIPLSCFQGRARQKRPDGGKCRVSMTDHAAGIGTCTQKWHDNSELSLFGDRSENIPWPSGISKLGREFPSKRLRKGSRARIAVDQGILSSQLAERPHQSKINYWPKFPCLWRIGCDDGGRFETVLR